MKYYKLRADVNNYAWLECKDKYFNQLFSMRGESLLNEWDVITLTRIHERVELPLGDYPNFTVPIVSNKIKAILDSICDNYIEYLPIKIKKCDEIYYIFNVLNILDCINKEKSDIKYFSDGGLMEIQNYTFNEIPNNESKVFRIKGYEKSIYINNDVKNTLEQNNCFGLLYEDTSLPYENPFKKLLL